MMLKRLLTFLFFSLTILNDKAVGQSQSLQTAFEMPTRVVYDLMVDKRGFLWMGSDLGISKFDGVNLVNFKSAQQSSLSAIGLCEDNQGRIWFTNLTGQIFYIQDEKMYLLKAYNYQSDHGSPRIALFDNKLIATTDDGLFVMDLKAFTVKYIRLNNDEIFSNYSVAVMNNYVLVYGKSGYYKYSRNGIIKRMEFKMPEASTTDLSKLNPVTYNDTAYLQSNPSGTIRKISIKNDSIKFSQTIKYGSFINSVTIHGSSQWINTTKSSYLLNSKKEFKNLNISDIVTDKEGNNWISTLGKGVFVNYRKNPVVIELKVAALDSSDVITALLKTEKAFYLGTQRGALIAFDPMRRSIIRKTSFDSNLGPINAVAVNKKGKTFVAFPSSLLILDDNKKTINVPLKFTKQIIALDEYSFVVSGSGLIAIPDSLSTTSIRRFVTLFGNHFTYDNKMGWFKLDKRCREICFDTQKRSLVLALDKGLYYLNKGGLHPIYYNNKPVYASSVCYAKTKLYAGTINEGLLIFDNTGVKQISVNEGLLSDNILKLKLIGDHLWLIGSGPLQLFDLNKNSFARYYNLPSRKDAQVIDVNETGKDAYLTTLNGLLIYPLNELTTKPAYLKYSLSVKVNNLSVPYFIKGSYSYMENNIGFKIEIPNFYYAKDIYIKYRLLSSADTTWKVTEPGGRQINFSSLPWGDYTFEAVAVNPKANLYAQVVSYSFQISPPWWKRTWVRFFVAILIFAIINYIVISYHFRQIAYQRAFYEEQESVRIERQRISSEIHDDIGSGLFAIHLYADRARKKLPQILEITELSKMVNGIAEKIRDIIWSTNTENDNLENLIYYTQFQIEKMFENSSIEFVSLIPEEIPDANVSSQVRRDIFLVMKELAHNSLKHSKAQSVEMVIEIADEFLKLLIKDNGIGFEDNKIQVNSMGLENIQIRIRRLNGFLTFKNNDVGTEVTIEIPLKEIITLKFNDKLKKWQLSIFEILRRAGK